MRADPRFIVTAAGERRMRQLSGGAYLALAAALLALYWVAGWWATLGGVAAFAGFLIGAVAGLETERELWVGRRCGARAPGPVGGSGARR